MARSNEELIADLRASGVLREHRVIEALRAVDRADFVPEELRGDAYADHPLPIGHAQTISQPTTVAFLLELLDPKPHERILDVGSGSGWTTALLAHIVGPEGEVIGVERVPELAPFGQRNLGKYSFAHARIERAGEELGKPSEAPFDRILVSAAAQELPDALVRQLRIGGRLVLPIGNAIWRFDRIAEEDVHADEYYGFAFVPLR